MYSFKDTTINLNSSKRFLPTSAMMYDGMYLEDLIEGYQTLTIEGREMLSVEVEQQEIQIGSIITNQKIPSRTLKITYKLEDRDPEKLQFKFKELLNYLYRNEDVEIRFHDELDFITTVAIHQLILFQETPTLLFQVLMYSVRTH